MRTLSACLLRTPLLTPLSYRQDKFSGPGCPRHPSSLSAIKTQFGPAGDWGSSPAFPPGEPRGAHLLGATETEQPTLPRSPKHTRTPHTSARAAAPRRNTRRARTLCSHASGPNFPAGLGTSPSVTVASASSPARCTSSCRDFGVGSERGPAPKSCSSVTKRSCTRNCRRAGTRAMVRAPLPRALSAPPPRCWAPRETAGGRGGTWKREPLSSPPRKTASPSVDLCQPAGSCGRLSPRVPHPATRSARERRDPCLSGASQVSEATPPGRSFDAQVWGERQAPGGTGGLEAEG